MATLYPCKECQTHFKTVIERNPPEVESSVSFQEWMCKVHNAVNEKLGKELFDCAKIDERWGGVECFGEDGNDGGCSFENAPGKGVAECAEACLYFSHENLVEPNASILSSSSLVSVLDFR